MRIKINIFPPGGHKFKEPDGTLIVANTWAGVIARSRLYRKRNNLPAGDPDAEVHAQVCARTPSICVHDDGGTTQRATQEVSLKGRVLRWFGEMRQRKPGFVDEHSAKARAAVCKQCVESVGLPEGCTNCRRVLNEMRRGLLGGGRPAEDRLTHRGCAVLGGEPAAMVWIDEPTVENAALPAHCWKKRVL